VLLSRIQRRWWKPGSPELSLSLPRAPRRSSNRIAEEIGLHGTPTLVWRKADGSVGEIDGIPKNWDALIAEVEEAHNVSR
jgi:hypothetical protein